MNDLFDPLDAPEEGARDLFGHVTTDASAAESDWRNGYSLEHLQALAAPFKALKRLTHGAFGIPKERDVAAALKSRRMFCDSLESPAVSAIAYQLKTGGNQRDFRGEAVAVPAGDVIVSDVGLIDSASSSQLQAVLDSSLNPKSAQWLEWFEEDDRKQWIVDLGFQWTATKISASSEIKGLYVRASNNDTLAARLDLVRKVSSPDDVSIACLNDRFISPAMLAEVRREIASSEWAQHYSSYNKRSTWTAFALRGYQRQDPAFIIKPREMSAAWKRENAPLLSVEPDWTVVAEKFPASMQIVKALGSQFDRVRFMRLAANGGELTRHADITDRDAGTADGKVTRLHIPIVTSESCIFQSWGIRGHRHEQHFPEGSLCYLDQRRPHAVANPASVERIHLVVDVYATPDVREMFHASAWSCLD